MKLILVAFMLFLFTACTVVTDDMRVVDIATPTPDLRETTQPRIEYRLLMLVHVDNPVEQLTQEYVDAIYNREITNWIDVGGEDALIRFMSDESLFEVTPALVWFAYENVVAQMPVRDNIRIIEVIQ